MIVAALIVAWAVVQFAFEHQPFRSCIGGICDVINNDNRATETPSR
jgi:hypothetical protein